MKPRITDFPIGNSCYSLDAYLDARYGALGTASREQFDNEAFDFVKDMIGEDEFERMMTPSTAFA